jgi:signal transduction histidine kinase/ActR/RegA family two-component response regulator
MPVFRLREWRSVVLPLAIGFVLLIGVLAALAWFSAERGAANAATQRTLAIELRLSRVLALLQDAETGQRGYLLTAGDAAYLEPYEEATRAMAEAVDGLAALVKDAAQTQRLAALKKAVDDKFLELKGTIDLQRAGRTAEALAKVKTGAGKQVMDNARRIIEEMATEQIRLLDQYQARVEAANTRMHYTTVAAFLLLLAVAGFALVKVQQQTLGLAAANVELQSAHGKLLQETLQRERLESQIRQTQKMEAIGQLTGGLAHDFNNMLAVIISALNLLQRRMARGEANVKEFIDAAIDGAHRAAALTHRLLAFARQQPLSPEPIDANKFVSNISDILGRTLGETVKLETVLAGGLWRIHADSAQLETTILNLAVNARDAMGDGGRLTIETANAHLDDDYAAEHIGVPPGQYVLIAVSDTGAGMAAATIDKAFDPFFTTKASGRGTGLGLSQVHGFVKQSLGHVKIYSEVGNGTTVKLYLPRFRGPEEPTVRVKQPAKPLQAGDAQDVVLVVEDEERVRQLSVEALRELGYTVLEAPGAVAALKVLDERPDISLLFTDIVMPDINGRRLADEATRRRPDLRVLYTTGYTNNAVIHNGVLDAGVHLLTKPFTLEQLAAKVHEALNSE